MRTFITFLCALFWLNVNATIFYVSPSGNDWSDGLSPQGAWTAAAVTKYIFSSGDTVKWEGGKTFNVSFMRFSTSVSHNSYGIGRATLVTDTGCFSYIDRAGVSIRNLVIVGPGSTLQTEWLAGIEFYLYAAAVGDREGITVDNVDVSGFGGWGLQIWSDNPLYGYNNITVTNSGFHHNGMGGICTQGFWNGIYIVKNNSNAIIRGVKAWSNSGRADKKDNWSGSGIFMSAMDGGLIDSCEAWDNGSLNAATAGGPVGIWVDHVNRVAIRRSYSHHNKGGTTHKDGGGFDIDGGCSRVVIEQCMSTENEGAGYSLFQWATATPFTDDTIRNNISINDARWSGYGALTFWGHSIARKITNSLVADNYIYFHWKPGYGMRFLNNNMSNVTIRDNQFFLGAFGVYTNGTSTAATITNTTQTIRK